MSAAALPLTPAPSSTPLSSSGTTSVAAGPVLGSGNTLPGQAATGDDFVAVLTQLLGAGTVSVTPVATQSTATAETEQKPVDAGDGTEPVETPVDNDVLDEILEALGQLGAPTAQTTVSKSTAKQEDAEENSQPTDGAAELSAGQVAALVFQNTTGASQAKKAVADAAADVLAATAKTTDKPDASLANDDSSHKATPTRDAQSAPGADTVANLQTAGAADSRRIELHVQERVGSPGWRDEVAAKLTWMVERGVQSGSLRLSPDNLGPLEVRISVQKNDVSVWFGAAHADTRAAIEQALPRLRELMAAQGMSLADAGVFREPPKDTPRSYSGAAFGNDAIGEVEAAPILRRATSLLDTYA